MAEWSPDEQREHRELWTRTLRSQLYRQGKTKLRVGDTYCCLGVACDLFGLGKWVVGEDVPLVNTVVHSSRYEYRIGDSCEVTVLPEDVRLWLGLRNTDGGFGEGELSIDGFSSLAALNDQGYSFTKIADIIDREHGVLVDDVQ